MEQKVEQGDEYDTNGNFNSWDDQLVLNVNQVWARWEDRFMAIMEECIPQSRLPKKRNRPGYPRKYCQHEKKQMV